MSSTTPVKVDVFVSGAGPVGLFFAYQMASRGYSVYCVDLKSGPTNQSRAISITSRSMEILEARGLASRILAESVVASGVKFYRYGVLAAQLDSSGDTNYPHMTLLIQGTTERVFYESLKEETECDVQWNTELVSYTQDDDCVTSIVRNIHTQEEKIIQSTFIVGADGTHSRVRKGNPDWTYEGVSIPMKFFLADVTLKGEGVENRRDKSSFFMRGASMAAFIPLNPLGKTDDNVYRVFGNLESYSQSDVNQKDPTHGLIKNKEEESPSLEFVQKALDKMTAPLKFEVSKLIWSSYFRINERIANGFRKKQAFLIGDAAHCHAPVGGQGMNLGLQDADNLAWKMSDVLGGHVLNPEKLLDSYSEEREPRAKSTIAATSNATRNGFMGTSDFLGDCRTYLTTTALMIPQIKNYIFQNAMQQSLTTEPNSSIMGTSDKGLLQVGHFLPESSVLRKSIVGNKKQKIIERKSLHEILVGNEQYVALYVSTRLSQSTPNTDLIERFWKDTRGYPVRRLVVQSAWHSQYGSKYPEFVTKEEESVAEEAFYSEERIDLPNSVTSLVGLLPLLNSFFASTKNPPSVLVIIRPDLYIAHSQVITNEVDFEKALHFFSDQYVSS